MSQEDRKTNVPDFLSELDAGVLNNGGKGKVTIELDFARLSNSMEEKRVEITHKLKFSAPTPRGKRTEEDTTKTPMYVGKGGKLTIMQEDQGQLFSLQGQPDGKLKAIN
ncbi:hypothetical protein ACOVY4_000893 [Proteus mirabilis]